LSGDTQSKELQVIANDGESLKEVIASHNIDVASDPRAAELVKIANKYKLSTGDLQLILTGLDAWENGSVASENSARYNICATFLVEHFVPRASADIGALLGRYERLHNKQIPPEALEEIGASLSHLASMRLRTKCRGGSNSGAYILGTLLEKSFVTNSNLSPEILPNYLSAIAASLTKKSGGTANKGSANPSTRQRLVAVISFIKRHDELVPLPILKAFLDRISELPAADVFFYGTENVERSISEEYEHYQSKVGQPLLSETEHAFLVKGLARYRSKDVANGLGFLRGVGILREFVGREFTDSEQEAILAIQASNDKYCISTHSESMCGPNPFVLLSHDHLDLFPDRLKVAEAICKTTRSGSFTDEMENLDEYLSWAKNSNLSEEDIRSRLACLIREIGRRKVSEEWSEFICTIAEIDSHTQPHLSLDEFSTLASF
jgi:hypothetical protein